jgi:8-oxo-dGTP diphosphatase
MTSTAPRLAPAVTTDVVIFTIRDNRLSLLLVRRPRDPFQGMWALPGGFVAPGEDLEQSATQALSDRAGVTGVYLEQLYTFGKPARDPRGRVVSVAYYALVPSERLPNGKQGPDAAVGCFPVDGLPELAFDHADIANLAHQRLAAKLAYSTIAFQFLPEQFTLRDLQSVYEIIMHQRLDKRNFRKQILAMNQIEETGDVCRKGNHRPARLYRVKRPGQVEIIK